jgi:hypothetical protein
MLRPRYAFIRDNNHFWPVRLLCRVLDVHPSGFYAWLQQPDSRRHHADLKLTGQIKQFWLESGCVYDYRKIHLDLRDTGQQCGVNRVWRLMKRAGIRAQVGYRSPRLPTALKCLDYPWRFRFSLDEHHTGTFLPFLFLCREETDPISHRYRADWPTFKCICHMFDYNCLVQIDGICTQLSAYIILHPGIETLLNGKLRKYVL